jgi:hypothetical protein
MEVIITAGISEPELRTVSLCLFLSPSRPRSRSQIAHCSHVKCSMVQRNRLIGAWAKKKEE